MFVPELISMNMMMAGMAPVMSLLMMGRDMRAMQPTELLAERTLTLKSARQAVESARKNDRQLQLLDNGVRHRQRTPHRSSITRFVTQTRSALTAKSPTVRCLPPSEPLVPTLR